MVAPALAAAPVQFLPDQLPAALGRRVLIDVNPSKLSARQETPTSIAFFLPRRWLFDARAVARECTPAQAAAVRCPRASRVGLGHLVLHVAGYLFPGGQTD